MTTTKKEERKGTIMKEYLNIGNQNHCTSGIFQSAPFKKTITEMEKSTPPPNKNLHLSFTVIYQFLPIDSENDL